MLFFLLSACRRGSHTPIPSGTRRASHFTFYSHLSTLSCKTRATFAFAFHPWAFCYFRIVFSIWFSHAQWTSMQHSHFYSRGIYTSIYVPRRDLPQKGFFGDPSREEEWNEGVAPHYT
ncbi:hypothetical protein CY34DRAFT_401123 [Suillus luteus UH-Slu-Lm8-n1]|uniref:Uncharacterized protein n=1 Tax=Suillus luteus UH-Slu-Lm8-n1 TaxID=930992 RepID=A0A0D0BA03_9AGAM|nr:hypothetical protein CY34DRAFT_401123 [Suillus luteus UH-Slu-Lm8-n1]